MDAYVNSVRSPSQYIGQSGQPSVWLLGLVVLSHQKSGYQAPQRHWCEENNGTGPDRIDIRTRFFHTEQASTLLNPTAHPFSPLGDGWTSQSSLQCMGSGHSTPRGLAQHSVAPRTILNSCSIRKPTSCPIPGKVILSVPSIFSQNWHQHVESQSQMSDSMCPFLLADPQLYLYSSAVGKPCIWNTFSLGVSPLRFSFLLSVRDFAHHWPSSVLSPPLCGLTLFSHFLISQEAFLSKSSGRRAFAQQLAMLGFGE